MEEGTNWRGELEKTVFYRKKYAFWPAKCGTESVWLKHYYKKYVHYDSKFLPKKSTSGHTEFSGNLTERDFIVESLMHNPAMK